MGGTSRSWGRGNRFHKTSSTQPSTEGQAVCPNQGCFTPKPMKHDFGSSFQDTNWKPPRTQASILRDQSTNLGVDSPVFSIIALFKDQLFPPGFGAGFSERRMPGKSGKVALEPQGSCRLRAGSSASAPRSHRAPPDGGAHLPTKKATGLGFRVQGLGFRVQGDQEKRDKVSKS